MRLIFGLLAALCLATPATAQVMIPSSDAQIKLSFAPLVKATGPAVVNIFAERVFDQGTSLFASDPMFSNMFEEPEENQPRVQNSLGSGVILSEDGIVVSNYHVVGMATEIRVVLTDRREFSARILLADKDTDLAILKIESDAPLPWLRFRDSDYVEVGELVLAIGNPFGIGQTVSSGIVSGLARSGIATGNSRGYFLQTDAPINPGNSGGALIDMSGQLIGVNTSILTRSGGSNGIGFAIPSNLVMRFVEQAKAGNAAYERPWAGIRGRAVTVDLARGAGLFAPLGVVISELHPESPFKEAGLISGDIVLNVDGLSVNTPAEMLFRMSIKPLGQTINVIYLRNNKEATSEVLLRLPPESFVRSIQTVDAGALRGLMAVNITPELRAAMKLPEGYEGVFMGRVPKQLEALGFREGDIIKEMNGIPMVTADDVIKASLSARQSWHIVVERGGEIRHYRFRL